MSNPKVEAAHKSYVDTVDNLNRHYGLAGVTIFEPDVWNFLVALSYAYSRASAHREHGSPHPWLPEGTPTRMDYMMHELSRSHDYIEQQKRVVSDLRSAWIRAKIEAGEFVSTASKLSVGIEE